MAHLEMVYLLKMVIFHGELLNKTALLLTLSPLSITPLHHPSPYGIMYVFSCVRCRPAPATVFQRRVADVENAQDIQHLGILVSLTRAHIA